MYLRFSPEYYSENKELCKTIHPDFVHFKFIKTKNETLARYLEGFYFFQKHASDDDLQYTVFSSNYVILSVCTDADYEIGQDRISLRGNAGSPFFSLLTIAVETPLCCSYTGAVNEITFCFRPLGFNHFLGNDLSFYFRKDSFPFMPFPDFEDTIKTILEEKDEELLQEKIEEYWLSKLQTKEFGILPKIINRIQDDHTTGIREIADELGISRQHIVRLFDAHLCKSPSVFRKIERFRKTLRNRVALLSEQDNLTSLTYESFFYDQSHLIKDFKSLTGMSPRKFFEGNRAFENGSVNWFFPSK